MKNFPTVAIAARGQGTIFSERRVPQEQTGLFYTVPLWGAALTIRLSACVCVCNVYVCVGLQDSPMRVTLLSVNPLKPRQDQRHEELSCPFYWSIPFTNGPRRISTSFLKTHTWDGTVIIGIINSWSQDGLAGWLTHVTVASGACIMHTDSKHLKLRKHLKCSSYSKHTVNILSIINQNCQLVLSL